MINGMKFSVHDGFRIDGNKVRFWRDKKTAVSNAKSIGWPVLSVEKVHTRFAVGYAIRGTLGDFLGREEFAAMVKDRGNK